MSTVKEEVQKLEPDAVIELFKLDALAIGGDELYFHGNTTVGSIWWQGVEYSPWPLEAKGFARTSEQQPQPNLTVANLDGSITTLCMLHDDLIGSTFTRIRTFGRFLDAVNFKGPELVAVPFIDTIVNNALNIELGSVTAAATYQVRMEIKDLVGVQVGVSIAGGTVIGPLTNGTHDLAVIAGDGTDIITFSAWEEGESTFTIENLSVREEVGNAEANPNEFFPPEVWFLERKVSESNENVQFELVSAFDIGGIMLPRRQVIANYCSWKSMGGYRGVNCQYNGPPVAKADGTPTTLLSEDACGGKIADCKLREWPDDQLNFGGFPAAGLMRT